MGLVSAATTLLALVSFAFAFACAGNWILRRFSVQLDSDAESMLVAMAVGVISTEILLFLVLTTQHIRVGCSVVLAILCLPLISELRLALACVSRTLVATAPRTQTDRGLYALLAAVVSIEFLTAIAPLSGSDALHYHFTVPKLILENGFHPIYSLSHSFLCGQGHLLILLGLALGSEKLALAFIFLGGLLTALCLVCLAKRWASGTILPSIVLLFLVTPVIFWQTSSSGAPDVWMAFFVSTAVIVLSQKKMAGTWQQASLAGFLAGGVAGAKYTGCIMAAGIAGALIVEFRSVAKTALLFGASLLAGIWPYLRNFVWTLDPVFPFLSKRLFPDQINSYALANLLADTGMTGPRHFYQLFPFVFFAGMRTGNLGFWDFYGPLVLSAAPLILLAFRNDRVWRVSMCIWFLSAVGVFHSSGMARFLLPVFPIGLSCVVAGIEFLNQKDWKITRFVALASMAGLCVVGTLALAIFSRASLPASLGINSSSNYLDATVQDFQLTQTINQVVSAQPQRGKAVVFFRHIYYLRVPFVNGNPNDSWAVDPDRLKTPDQWTAFFAAQGIRYVVRSPSYPVPIASPLLELEGRGDLIPIAQTEVQNFRGMRMNGERVSVPVFILKLKQ
jgi:hypothetical protein